MMHFVHKKYPEILQSYKVTSKYYIARLPNPLSGDNQGHGTF